ncbi:MAG: transcriptional regulator [Planctomycetales bacterium]
MNSSAQVPESSSDELPRELIELGKCIARMPVDLQPNLDAAYIQVVDGIRRRRRILNLVQEALSQLRLDIKYLMFDLDVTRRERDELRQRLSDNDF